MPVTRIACRVAVQFLLPPGRYYISQGYVKWLRMLCFSKEARKRVFAVWLIVARDTEG